MVRTLRAEGGSATVTYSGGKVDLVDYSPHFGYLVDAYRDNDQSITVRFLGFFHVSTVQAFVDSKKTFQTTVKEEAS